MSARTLEFMLWFFAAGIFAIVLVAIGISAWNTHQHGGCAEYRETGGLTCFGSNEYTHCDPVRECVRYGDGTIP